MESVEIEIPQSLKNWFVIHFAVDLLLAIPLLFLPELILPLFGWKIVDPITSRLVGAALLGIGGESFLGRNSNLETFRAMLNLKIIWASAAILGLGLGIYNNGPPAAWAFLVVFAIFLAVWVHYRSSLKK